MTANRVTEFNCKMFWKQWKYSFPTLKIVLFCTFFQLLFVHVIFLYVKIFVQFSACSSLTMEPHPSELVELKSSLPSSSSASVSSLTTSGLGSLHGSSEEMSETSDYQRSTPSPRDQDDDLFMGHLIQSKANKSNFHVRRLSNF